MNNQRNLKRIRTLAWAFAQEWNEKADDFWGDDTHFANSMKIKRQDITDSIFIIDGEIRISGEESNHFSLFFVNYWDDKDCGGKITDYLQKNGCWAEWYCPGYMTAGVRIND